MGDSVWVATWNDEGHGQLCMVFSGMTALTDWLDEFLPCGLEAADEDDYGDHTVFSDRDEGLSVRAYRRVVHREWTRCDGVLSRSGTIADDVDPENVYGSDSMRQSVEEDRK